MESNSVVETSDDDEIELNWPDTAQTNPCTTPSSCVHSPSPSKRRKLYHDFEPGLNSPDQYEQNDSALCRSLSLSSPYPPSASPRSSPSSLHEFFDEHLESKESPGFDRPGGSLPTVPSSPVDHDAEPPPLLQDPRNLFLISSSTNAEVDLMELYEGPPTSNSDPSSPPALPGVRSPSLGSLSLFSPPKSSSSRRYEGKETAEDLSFPTSSPSPEMDVADSLPSPSRPRLVTNTSQDSTRSDLPAEITMDGPQKMTPLPVTSSGSSDVDTANISRYPLRKRAPAQMKPYTIENARYKRQFHENPDAIVRQRELDLQRVARDHYDHSDDILDESQSAWQPPEESQDDFVAEEWLRPIEPLNRKKASDVLFIARTTEGQPPQPFTELLQDWAFSDEEDSESMQTFAQEGERLARKQRKTKRDFERQAKAPAGQKQFPVKQSSRSFNDETSRSPPLLVLSTEPKRSQSPPAATLDVSQPHSSILSPSSNISTQVPVRPYTLISPTPLVGADPTDSESDHYDTASSSEADSEHQEVELLGKGQKPKAIKTLLRMYPASMLKSLVTGPSNYGPAAKRRMTHPSGSEDEEAAVLPGRSRSGWSTRPWKREVKGDSESSDQELTSDHEGEMSEPGDRQNFNDLVDLTKDSDEDDGVDDWEIEAYLAGDSASLPDQITSVRQVREKSLIDWMLSRTSTIGGTRHLRTKMRPSDKFRRRTYRAPSDFKLDVTIQGSRRERQTKLNFDDHTKKPSNHRRRRQQFAQSAQSNANSEPDHNSDRVQAVPDNAASQKGKKQKKHVRRTRAREKGVHIFTSDDTRMVGGSSVPAAVTTIIEEDDGFAQAIAPLYQEWATPLQSAHVANTKSTGPPSAHLSHPLLGEDVQIPRAQERPFSLDCGIGVLTPGLTLTFSDTSYIRKGWLHELVGMIGSQKTASAPTAMHIHMHGIDLSWDMDSNAFLKSLVLVFDKISDIMIEAPDIACEDKQWLGIYHAANHLLSWHLSSAIGPDVEHLRGGVEEQILAFTAHMRGQSLAASSLNLFTLSACWFVVELSARLDSSCEAPASSKALKESVPLLLEYLLGYGLEAVMPSVANDTLVHRSIMSRSVLELWVSLFHLLDSWPIKNESSKKSRHPFVLFLQGLLETTVKRGQNPLRISESIWHLIFSLCALTQFSVNGMIMRASRLPASWELVVFALKQVRLNADPVIDQGLSRKGLDQRDLYASWIAQRCFLLCDTWHWPLDDIHNVFDRLSKIFQSRNFAGLRHEKPDYPLFLINNDWAVLTKLESKDTAFVVFLKLLFRAVGCDDTNPQRQLSPKAKKMLSMAASVTKLPYSKKFPTAVQDLSMLINRLATVAIGIHLDPPSHAQRMRTARTYVDFSDADSTTRCGVIRGMIYLAVMLMKAKLPMGSIISWVAETASILANEHKTLVESSGKLVVVDKHTFSLLRIDVQLLIGAVRQILQAYRAMSAYPEPALLHAIEPLIRAANVVDEPTTAENLREMVQAFLDARKIALPSQKLPSKGPSVVCETQEQESQEDYPPMAIDFNDPSLLAALGAGDTAPSAQKSDQVTLNEEALSSHMTPFTFWAWRNLNRKATDSVASASGRSTSNIEMWMACWVGCADVEVHAGRKSWGRWLNMSQNWKQQPENMYNRLNFLFFKKLLVIDPTTYMDQQDEYMKTLFAALVSPDIEKQQGFIRLVFDICGKQHPLLSGVCTETNAIDQKSTADILRVIVENISRKLASLTPSSPETIPLVDLCVVIYQAMKRNSLKDKSMTPGAEELRTYFRDIGNFTAMSAPTNATQAKDRVYGQLAASLGRMSRAVGRTADLCEQLQVDLHAMRTFAGLDAAKRVNESNLDNVEAYTLPSRFMTIAAQLNPEDPDETEPNSQLEKSL
ncbi:hypothetical protein H0H93_016690 [Arthromyces matolae]|nr:hypothetical protein H0H93_016690 [Arthromyces matolae]